MNFRQFAFNNVIRNKRTYVAHFLSSAFSVMIFFIYAMLAFHPDLKGQIMADSITLSKLGTMGMKVSQYVVFAFSFLFLLYSVSSFIKLRKKEFGILLLLGMSRKQLNRMLFIENIAIGVAAIITGIVVGVVFSKLILLICATMLAVERGLPFYLPTEAILLTAGSYLVLFMVVAAFTSLITKKGALVELIKAEDKPKPEPKASVSLSILAVLLIGLGYACVFLFVLYHFFSFFLLFGGVILVIIGTYFLFTQLSVYVMRALKKRPRFVFKRTNLLTVSELVYRMKDNAVMFFMVAIISATAFTGIGTALTIGDPGLTAMKNPYAFTYTSFPGPDGYNLSGEKHVRLIEQTLKREGFTYQMASYTLDYADDGTTLMRLSDYNRLAAALGHPQETLRKGETMGSPSSVTQNNKSKLEGLQADQVTITKSTTMLTLHTVKALHHIVIPNASSSGSLIITDADYETLKKDNEFMPRYTEFVVPEWRHTRAVAEELSKALNSEASGEQNSPFNFNALVLDWLYSKQLNGIMLIVSGLVGIVFFTFAASFIYFRLYADLFFLPLLVAFIHSGVAFIALQRLVDFSVVSHTLAVFATFLGIQVIYFFVTRWRYLGHLYEKVM